MALERRAVRAMGLACLMAMWGVLSAGVMAEGVEVRVRPERIDDVLVNPNMGLAHFHLGWVADERELSAETWARRSGWWRPEGHPDTAVTYFRWLWRDIEPEPGVIDFDYIDRAIQASSLTGQTLSFRVMAIRTGGVGIPDWLRERVEGVEVDGTFWPDYRDEAFREAHRSLTRRLGERYDGHPGMDHIDIGTVGCWGEWNVACIEGERSIIEILRPRDDAARDAIADAYRQVVADWADAFEQTPLVMPLQAGDAGRVTGVTAYALERGCGWRVDCWGDWGSFGPNWNHHEDLYPRFMREVRAMYPAFDEVWKHAPVQLEVCGHMENWARQGWDVEGPDGAVYKTFAFALEHHAAVLNAKFAPVPEVYREALAELLRRNGYRFVIDEVRHAGEVEAGEVLVIKVNWANLGTTPAYTPRTVTYRLRGAGESYEHESDADIRTWLPGEWEDRERFRLPEEMAAGRYVLEVALVSRPGERPETVELPPLKLGIAGGGEAGWYRLSEVRVR